MAKYTTEIKIYNPEENKNIFKIGDRYCIPLYQRAYAWKEKQIKQLIEDINDYPGHENYYIGSLVVYKRADDYEVIDGQQRLTTLFLLFNYLGFDVEEKCLQFDCRGKSNKTLQCITKGTFTNMNDEDIESSLSMGMKIIEDAFGVNDDGQKIDKEKFKKNLQRVVLYRIEVPEGTDLNHYFEIMNTRGEQLEQHDVLKAMFMKDIVSPSGREMFAKIWSACSDMDGYVQMNITDTKLRQELFSEKWNVFKPITFIYNGNEKNSDLNGKVAYDINDKLNAILHNSSVEVVNTIDKEERKRFESIIDFPHFLLHVLRVFKNVNKIDDLNVDKLLDDKSLIEEYKLLFKSGKVKFPKLQNDFINCLLKCRILFDKYIIKREFAIQDKEGEWSLKQINKSENDSPYYTQTDGLADNVLMLEAAMRVSYTSPKVMHWITQLLIWLYKNEHQIDRFENEVENYIRESIKNNFFNKVNYNCMGIDTPHIVLNYLDYLLWKGNKDKYKDFVFEYRNTIEHWYPQHPSADTFEKWKQEEEDHFGNLCLLQRGYNSKFSNLEPHSKKSTFSGMIARGSLKLRLMAELTTEGIQWKDKYESLGEKMLQNLRKAIEIDDLKKSNN